MKHRILFAVLLTLTIAPLSMEGLLRVGDPWGAKRYADDSTVLFSHMAYSPARGYAMVPGTYQFSNWQAVILADRSRAVPDTTGEECTIVLLGDSVTFGYGVSDIDTWANLLARDFPGVHIVNTGVNGYNIANVWRTLLDAPADGYLYMMIGNDADAEFPWQHPNSGSDLSTISLYLNWVRIMRAPAGAPPDLTAFNETLDKLAARDDVMVVAFEGWLTDKAKEHDPGIRTIPMWTHNNSRVDGHPNAAGSVEVEAAIKPAFETLVNRVCKGITIES